MVYNHNCGDDRLVRTLDRDRFRCFFVAFRQEGGRRSLSFVIFHCVLSIFPYRLLLVSPSIAFLVSHLSPFVSLSVPVCFRSYPHLFPTCHKSNFYFCFSLLVFFSSLVCDLYFPEPPTAPLVLPWKSVPEGFVEPCPQPVFPLSIWRPGSVAGSRGLLA